MEGFRCVTATSALSTGRDAGRISALSADSLALGLLALASVVFFVSAAIFSAHAPLWMDEVLAVWTARQPSAGAIIRALESGSEFNPPLYHLLLHWIIRLGAAGNLAMRAPSIIFTYVTGLCAFELVRRRYAIPVAALAMTACLVSGLSNYAVQARPYALVAACFSLALVLWDIPAERRPSLRSAVAIGLLLALAIGSHFYALLLAVSVGLAELIWTVFHRRVRWRHLIAIAFACLSMLVWLPILQHATAFNAADARSPHFYARPSLPALIASYVGVLLGHAWIWTSLVSVLIGVVIAGILLKRDAKRPVIAGQDKNLDIIVTVTCLIPVTTFLFSVFVTHAFNGRYVIAAALGFSILTARYAAALPRSQWVCCLLIVILLPGALFPIRTVTDAGVQALEALQHAPGGLPIATDDGLLFFELREGAATDVAQRLVYIVDPAGAGTPDLTNEHQVLRWAAISPAVKTGAEPNFITSQSRFLIFEQAGDGETLSRLATASGFDLAPVSRTGSATLYLADRRSR